MTQIMKQFGCFKLDLRNDCLWRDTESLELPPKPFAVLRYLVDNPGRVISHDELLEALWPDTYVQPQVLRTYMLDLRKILGDDARDPHFIQTLPKRGYRFVACVTEAADVTSGLADGAPTDKEPVTSPNHANHDRAAEPPRLSPLFAATKPSSLVGRDKELAQLQALVAETCHGRRQVVFIKGEVGIGKTALVDEFCRWAGGSVLPVNVARGQCVEGFGGKEEYYPWMEVLSQLCTSPGGAEVCKVLAAIAPSWLAVPGLSQLDRSVPQPPSRDRMPGELCAALEELAAERPLILLFEDLHWADDSSLHLISALARRRAGAQLMILGTYRPHTGLTAGSGENPLKAIEQDLLMRRLGTELALAPLEKAAVRELLIAELKQTPLPSGLASFIHRHSEGNPLFAIALLEHLITEGFLARDAAPNGEQEWVQRAPFQELEAGVPDGLARMIELEVERLSPEQQAVLEAGSLMPVAFPAWAVAAALNKDPVETEDACDQLARRLYFLERAGQDELPDGSTSNFYVYVHGLYREVLYRRQSASRRTRRHIRIAERLRELFHGREASVARDIALHYEAAGHLESAVEALRTAAAHAGRRQANAEATDLLDRALRLTESLPGSEPGTDTGALADEIRSERSLWTETASAGARRK
jgi:DNA-binding winged helix-turn-helix (wHTH) protein